MISEQTSVRADSSASRGRGQEVEANSIVLLPPTLPIAMGDLVEVMGYSFEVESIQPRLNIMGRHDHNEVGLKIWVSKSEA
ncbi:hypothetical protein HSBAA_29820 [Vreelandella sulfidaeris]|uniref:Uncharacterized protein n=1 Tax=Vreelandella sulfidaeris TaxID=115553 RepID=A0A455U6C9_9GAMM|nr:hypothetical protein HSBAA_29820 [Halomonas sulfidaeris]